MSTDEALAFLKANQPLPPTSEISDVTLKRFDEVCEFFAMHPDERALPLILNAFGEGDGHGVYDVAMDVAKAFPAEVVLPALRAALSNPKGGVRYWAALIAGDFPDPGLVPPLGHLLQTGSVDEGIAAATTLEIIGGEEAREILSSARRDGTAMPEVAAFIDGILSTWD